MDDTNNQLRILLAKMLPKSPPDDCVVVSRALARLEALENMNDTLRRALKLLDRRIQELEDDGA
jgi:hypothetical protein